ncbi:membrane-associated phospholipid phosphatase [Microlunatus panaciterrae]|uniref:Membrane-associated phospholipid phosphatase n=1 Tax=Microlunatus panaciterrae TaxID=400768 RepID=A0ABS2RKC0_9ACTN|nr:membrane-associated phospholipid phosphatase [Microlunatus panaciterrae]
MLTNAPAGPGSALQDPERQRAASTAVALVMSLLALLAAAAIGWVALTTVRGQQLDDLAAHVLSAGSIAVADDLSRLLELVSVSSAALALAVLMGLALVRGRLRLAVGAAVLMAGANVTTQVLKHLLLTRPDLGYGTLNSLPSGHTTVVFSLVLAAVLVSPRPVRPLVVLAGSAVGTLTGLATLVAGWHRTSDVVAALLVTLAWAAAVTAVLAATTTRTGSDHGGGFVPAVLGALLAAGAAVLWGVGPGAGLWQPVAVAMVLAAIAGATALSTGAFAWLTSRTLD